MKKLFTLLVTTLLANTLVFGFSGSGSGTSADPYLVNNAAQLAEVSGNLTAYYKQMNDIDLSAYPNWTPLGQHWLQALPALTTAMGIKYRV